MSDTYLPKKMKILKKYLIYVLPLLSFTSKDNETPPDNRKLIADKSVSLVTYAMSHPMHSWEGTCKDVNAIIVINEKTRVIEQIAVALQLDTFNSGNANRDSHALEVMESLKFPRVIFTSNKIKVAAEMLSIEGNLNFHGITKPLTIIASREDFVNKLVVDGKFDVSLNEFKVERPTLMGLKTNDKMSLKFKVIFDLRIL